MDNKELGRVPTGQALAVPIEPQERLAASRCDPSRKNTLVVFGGKPFTVMGHVVTSGGIAGVIDRIANVPRLFSGMDLITNDLMPGASFHAKQEAMNRLCQRWRKLDLMRFDRGRWELTHGAWDKFQAIAMEARRAETGTGSVHDSAAIAQNPDDGLDVS